MSQKSPRTAPESALTRTRLERLTSTFASTDNKGIPSAYGHFWSNVDVGEPDECWEWTAGTEKCGYGMVNVDDGCIRAHRAAITLDGRVPNGKQVLHHCDNKTCVNPAHLYRGSPEDNVHDAVERGLHPKGESHGSAKLTAEDVKDIRQNDELTQVELAEKYGVSQPAISDIVNGNTWRCIDD